MEAYKKFYVSLIIGALASLLIYFIGSYNVQKIEETVATLVNNKFSINNYVLLINISFLRARRAEKNFIIFKSARYQEEIDRYLGEADNYIKTLEALNLDTHDKYALAPLKKSIDDYKVLVKGLSSLLLSKSEDEANLKNINKSIAEVNESVAENIMYIADDTRAQIAEIQARLQNYYKGLRTLPGKIIIIVITGIYIAVFYDDILSWLMGLHLK
jgi:CHASE3 domain sensor protein